VVVSADWKEVRLGEIAEIISGGTPSTAIGSYWGGDIPWCTPTDITSCKSNYLFETERKITPAGLAGSAASLLPPGSLLLCTRATVGDVRIASRAIATNQGFKSLVVNSQANSKFVYFVLQTLRQAMIEKSSGSTFLELGKNDLSNIVALMPPLKEQEAIAESLSDADTAIESLDALIAKKRDVKQATMQQLLTGRTRLPGFTADWKEGRLGEHAAFFKGNGLSKLQLIDDGPQQCVHYGELFTHYGPVIETVTSKCVAFEGSFKSLAGDVLMPGSDVTPRGLATASAIKVSDVVLGGDVIVIRTKSTLLYGPFLSNFIRMSKGRVLRLVKGSTVYHIHAKDLADLEVLMPPLKEQEAIAETLSVMDDELEALTEQVSKLRMVKEGMMQDLLTGRVRLV
jgi:type I restriction enzyme S subunit